MIKNFLRFTKNLSEIERSILCRFCWIFVVLFLGMPLVSEAQISLTINKTNNAPNPIPSGQPFTYTITYSWTGGAPGTLYIIDNLPPSLDVISALPASPISSISGNVVTFILTGLTLPSGSGTVQINARFKPGVTCEGELACNKAGISTSKEGPYTYSQESCVKAGRPVNKWTFEKEWIAGCACDDEVIYRIKIINPAGGDIGGLNLTNVSITDMLPANASVISVTPGGYSGTPPNITLTGVPSTFYVSPWNSWYVYYVKVKYPCANFQPGQTVVNSASLTFNTPCNQQMTTWTDTASTVICQGISQGNIYKGLSLNMYFPNNPSYYPVWAPGCCGTYLMSYTNTGTLAQPGFVMEDDIPGHLDVNTIKTNVPASNMPVTLDVYCWSGSSCSTTPCTTVVYNSAGMQTLTGLPPNVCKVKWTYSGSIGVSQNVYNFLDVCVRTTNFMTNNPVTPGQNVVNTVTVSANNLSPLSITHTKVTDQTQPKVIATKLFIGGCNNSCQVTPNGPYQPGDTVRFRMAVANIGNQNATSCTITDNLPAGLSYVGNETYYYGTFNWMANIYSPPCCSTTATVPTNIGGTITTPTVGSTNLTWTFPVLPFRCDGTVEYFIIEFDVKISDTPPAAPGQYQNTFTIGASNITNVTSNVAFLTVNQTAQLQAKKEIRKINVDGQPGPWSTSASIQAGGQGQFMITVQNTGNSPLTNLCLLDIMPWINDIKVLPPYNPRGSQFFLPYDPANGALNITPTGFAATYNTIGLVQSQNPTRSTECGGFCGVANPTGAVTGSFGATAVQTYSFKVSANSGVNLAPGNSLNVIIPFVAPKQVKPQETACNSFGVQAIPLNMPNVCLSAESNNACLTIEEGQPCIKVERATIQCISMNSSGQWLYQLQFTAINLTGITTNVNLIPNSGTVSSITPSSMPPNVATNFTAFYLSPNNGGQVCFKLWLIDPKSNKELCDTTFCFDLKPCPEPCPCPFRIQIDKANATQSSGNLVSFTNLLSVVPTPVLQARATIVSVTVNEHCINGGHTSYVPSAVFTSSNLNPLFTSGIGTSELTYTNYQCPNIINQLFNFTLNIPSKPKKGCYQKVKVCIRYTITDCKCTTCDTLVCYEFTRKWMPINTSWDIGLAKDVIMKSFIDNGKENNDLLMLDEKPFMTMLMKSETEGTLTINNPKEDEFTAGVTIHATSISSATGIKVKSVTPKNSSWTNGTPTERGMTSRGILEPGKSISFDIVFENSSMMKSWMNYVAFDFTFPGIDDTLSGLNEIKSRTPGISGGDELSMAYSQLATAEKARTFALRFTNNNYSSDHIAKLIVRVVDGTILAVGPQINNREARFESYRTSGGEWKLLSATPEAKDAIVASISPKSSIEPLFVSIVFDGKEFVEFEFETYTDDDELVTKGKLRVDIPTTGISDDDIIKSEVYLYDVIPNPAEYNVQFKFKLSSLDTRVNLTLTDARGKVIDKIAENTEFSAGEHMISYDTSSLANGVYYLNLSTPTVSQTRRMVIVR